MADSNMIQKQREILREFRQANPQRAQAEAEAEKQHKKEVAGAETFLQDKKNVANNAQAKVDKSIADTKGSLAKANLEYLYNESKFTEPSGNPEGDPEAELNKSVAVVEKASQDIESSVWNLEWWRQERAKRRQLLVRLAVVALVILAVAAFFGYQAWQRNNDLEARYKRAVVAFESRQWQPARNELNNLIAIERNYKDVQTLLRESYYRPAKKAFLENKWEDARQELTPLISIDANYKDTGALLRETYYIPSIQAEKSGNTKEAITLMLAMSKIDSNYKDVPQRLSNLIENREMQLSGNSAPEVNTSGPNSHMTIDSIKFSTIGIVTLKLSVIVDSGNSFYMYQPEEVYVLVQGTKILGTDPDGIFGRNGSFTRIDLGNAGSKGQGTIRFPIAIEKLLSTGCFEFHYDKYYNFTNLCLNF